MAIIFLIFGLALIAWATGRARANWFIAKGTSQVHSLPGYHGWFMAICALVPAVIFYIIWSNIAPSLGSQAVLTHPLAQQLPADSMARAAILSEARNLSVYPDRAVFNELAKQLAPIYADADRRYTIIGIAITLLLFFAGAAFGFTRIKPNFRARTRVERVVMLSLLLASLIAILATIGIMASLIIESVRFFALVSPAEFLSSSFWSPSEHIEDGSYKGFGALPLFWGTIFIGVIIAMLVAIPLGLMSAVYLTQYASAKLRKLIKPVLEVLAGIPTVVYGYFAALTIAPQLREIALAIGIAEASAESALAAGVVMGVMIIPFVSSMADDSISAVPSSMRDGSLAMGATRSETIRKVLIPAALPGVVGGVLLAVSRAIGETMIVVMAAGYAANMTANPFSSVTTVTVQIVQLLTGDTDFNSPITLAAFALGLTLFIITLLLNLVALHIVRKYREAYE